MTKFIDEVLKLADHLFGEAKTLERFRNNGLGYVFLRSSGQTTRQPSFNDCLAKAFYIVALKHLRK